MEKIPEEEEITEESENTDEISDEEWEEIVNSIPDIPEFLENENNRK